MEPLISVIVPVYKVEQYLRQCVDSILNQTYKNLEIILVDDGSPDNCPEICDEYAKRDGRVKVVHKPNGGLSDARNAGMEICSGQYLHFVDSDDALPVSALELLVNIAVGQQADLVIGNHIRFDELLPDMPETVANVRRMSKTEAMEDFFQNGCAAWARLYRRELHEGIQFPVGEINEDEAIVLQLLDRCKAVARTDAVAYFYRCRNESITTSSFSEKKLDWVKHCRENLAFIREKYPQLEECAAARYRSSILWSIREISRMDSGLEEAWNQLRKELIQNYSTFWKNAGKKEKARMLLLSYGPRSLLHIWMKKRSGI